MTTINAKEIDAADVKSIYKEMNAEQRAEFRNKVIERCRMPYPTFYTKVRSGFFTYLEMQVVKQVLTEMKKNR